MRSTPRLALGASIVLLVAACGEPPPEPFADAGGQPPDLPLVEADSLQGIDGPAVDRPGVPDHRSDGPAVVSECQSAWAAGLSPCDKVPDDYVVVTKAGRNLALCKAGATVGNFRVGLGFAPIGDKEKQGDGKTPEGTFYIPRLVPDSSYYKAFLLSYPDKADATRGLAAGLITAAQKAQIDAAQDACQEPPQSTGLGGLIEIHGHGSKKDWTLGCIALDDKDVDVLWAVLEAGDTIVVLP